MLKLMLYIVGIAVGIYVVAQGFGWTRSGGSSVATPSRSDAMAATSPFVALPPPVDQSTGTAYVVAPQNCTREEAARADQLSADLRARGVSVQRVDQVQFSRVEPAQMSGLDQVMRGRLPIVFVNGKAANDPQLGDVLREIGR
jgi:hypothetical protein